MKNKTQKIRTLLEWRNDLKPHPKKVKLETAAVKNFIQ